MCESPGLFEQHRLHSSTAKWSGRLTRRTRTRETGTRGDEDEGNQTKDNKDEGNKDKDEGNKDNMGEGNKNRGDAKQDKDYVCLYGLAGVCQHLAYIDAATSASSRTG